MPLVTCRDCGREVSGRVTFCPGCGGPMESGPPRRPLVQTIEQTGKGWKQAQLVGAVPVVLSAIAFVWSLDGQVDTMLAVVLFAAGFTLLVMGRLGAWWYHG